MRLLYLTWALFRDRFFLMILEISIFKYIEFSASSRNGNLYKCLNFNTFTWQSYRNKRRWTNYTNFLTNGKKRKPQMKMIVLFNVSVYQLELANTRLTIIVLTPYLLFCLLFSQTNWSIAFDFLTSLFCGKTTFYNR